MATNVDLSVIIPVGERHDDIWTLLEAYRNGLDKLERTYEIIVVLDGDRPEVLNALLGQESRMPNLQIAQLAREFGEATAITLGFKESRGDLILTLPAYFQVDPADFKKLFSEKSDYHMVTAHRWPRKTTAFDTLRRKVFHGILDWVTGQRYKDLGCGVRLFDREVLDEIDIYGDQSKFFPLVVERSGFRVLELDLRQSEYDFFSGRYQLRDYVRRLLDIFTIFFLVRFTKKPLRFFGMIGIMVLVLGAVGLAYVIFERLFLGQPLGDRPALLLSALMVVLGVQVVALGLLGELIIFTHARSIKEYKIEQIINPSSIDKEAESSAG